MSLIGHRDQNALDVKVSDQPTAITHALAQLGRNSVPVYVFYGKGETSPRLLPQILRLSMIEELYKIEEVSKPVQEEK